MNKKNEKKLVPRLRFPEFKNDGSWAIKNVSEIFNAYSGGTPSTSEKGYYGGKIPFIRSAEINKEETELFITEEGLKNSSAKIVKNGDLLVALYGANSGDSAISKMNGAINQAILCLQSEFSNAFTFNFLTLRKDWIVSKYIQGGQGNLSGDIIKSISIPYTNQKEQQKIASCLSSLDEVITAESQKLDVLKEHKRGLLQNLLPQEGETIPKYRFKEFEESGEWVFENFSKYIKLYRGSSPRPIQNYFTTEESGVNWIKIGDTKNASNFTIKQVEERISLAGAEKSRKVIVGELILANSMSYGKTYQLAIEGYIYDGWFVLREYEKHFDKQFLLQLLNSEYMQTQYNKLSAGGIVQNISSDIVYNTILPHTSVEEQKQIASTLSSIDELIHAQNQKIESLKLHKKGLLQGLFPDLDGSDGSDT